MDRGAGWATVHVVTELDMMKPLSRQAGSGKTLGLREEREQCDALEAEESLITGLWASLIGTRKLHLCLTYEQLNTWRIVVFRLFSHSFVSDFLRAPGLQHTKLPCPSLFLGVCSDSCPLSQWCQPTISSFAVSFSSCLQSFPASGSFLVSRLFAWGGQSVRASASHSFQWIFRINFL